MIGDRLKSLQRADARKHRRDALDTFDAFCVRQYLRLAPLPESARVQDVYESPHADVLHTPGSDLELVESRK